MIKTKGKVRLVQYSDKSWHVEYKRKWLPTLYWLNSFEEWTIFKPNYVLDEFHQREFFNNALNNLAKTKKSPEIIMEEDV